MKNSAERIMHSTQEQAVASWITYLNQMRLDDLIESLNRQDINLEEALIELNKLKQFLGDPSHILGSNATKHGEIAEHMQVNFSNARRAIQGLSKVHSFEGVGRTAPEDYLRDGIPIQSKFYNGLNKTLFGKHAILEHMEMYPDFLKNGGAYDIPKDQYEKMVNLLDLYKNKSTQLSTSDYYLAKRIDEFLKENNLKLGRDINPAVVDYEGVQQNAAKRTIDSEEKKIREEDKKQRQKDYKKSQPSLKEGMKATGVSAAIEGGLTFCISVAKKRKEKNFSEFTVEDWKNIGIDTGKDTVKGGIRGATVYVLSNFTATPANVASSYVTAAYGISAQIKELERGNVSKEDFVINCETVCLDVTISTIASIIGQTVIPVPVLGTVIGNIAGEFIYELCKKQGAMKAQEIIFGYNREMEALNKKLDVKYYQFLVGINATFSKFENLEEMAFDKDVNLSFIGSISLAEEIGANSEKILRSIEDIDCYFLT